MSTPITRARFDEICLAFASRAPISRAFGSTLLGNPKQMQLRLFFFPEDVDYLVEATRAHQDLVDLGADAEVLAAKRACWVTALWDRADMPQPPRVIPAPAFNVGQRVVSSRSDTKTWVGRLVRTQIPNRRAHDDWFVRADAEPDENLRPCTRRTRFPWAPSVRTVTIVTARVPEGLQGVITRSEVVPRKGVDYRADYEVRWDEPVVPVSTLAARVEPMEPEAQHRTSYTWWAHLSGPLPFTEVPDGQG